MVGLGGRRWALAALVAVAACGGGEFSAENGGSTGGAGPTGADGVSAVAATGGTGGSSQGGGGSSQGVVSSSNSVGGGAGDNSSGGSTGGGGATVDAAFPDAPAETSGGRDAAGPDVHDAAVNDGNVITKCPPVEPSISTACADGLDCTYGTHPRLACRKEYTCSGSHWLLAPGIACADLTDCTAEQPRAPQVGASCPTIEHDCIWSTGLYCRCRAGAMGATWDCYPPPSDCPSTPPNKGQACDLSAKTCDYGTCPLGTKVTTSCSGGIFRWSAPACP